MSLETLNAFIAKVESDSSLQEQLNNVNDANEAIAIANSVGFEITAGDLIRQQTKVAAELSDEELEGVAGGGLALKVATFVGSLYLSLGLTLPAVIDDGGESANQDPANNGGR